jgi:hypothetical protein
MADLSSKFRLTTGSVFFPSVSAACLEGKQSDRLEQGIQALYQGI